MTSSPDEVVVVVADVLDRLGIPYVVGGSVASSLLGEPRATVDVDLGVELNEASLDLLVDAFRPEFYVPEDAAREAVRNHDSFNLISNSTGYKVDFFVLGDGLLDRLQIERRISVEVGVDTPKDVWVTSIPDQIVRKLDWYRQGGGVSDRQWRDVIGLLLVHRNSMDVDDLRRLSEQVGLADLLDLALGEVDDDG